MKKILLPILLILISLVACNKKEQAPTAQEYLDLGEKYLLELNYEQAIVMFTKVIEIEPRNERAYLGAAQAYISLGQAEKAIEIMNKGLELFTDNEELLSMISALEVEFKATQESETVTHTETALEPEVPVNQDNKSLEEILPPLGLDTENLTGEPPFTIKDLEEWFYPPGTTIWDLQQDFGLTDEGIEKSIKTGVGALAKGNAYGEQLEGIYRGEVTCTSNGDLKIMHFADNSKYNPFSSQINFDMPRGIYFGMDISEVLNKFMLQDLEVTKFIDIDSTVPFVSNSRIANGRIIYAADESWAEIYYANLDRYGQPKKSYRVIYHTGVFNQYNAAMHDEYRIEFRFGTDNLLEICTIHYAYE